MTGPGDPQSVSTARAALQGRSAEDVLRWSLDSFSPSELVFSCSFGAEDMVILDLLAKIGRFPRVVTLDTGRLPQETYDLMDEARRKYSLPLEVLFPDAGEVEAMVAEHGLNLFYRSVDLRKLCCAVRKVHPSRRALKGCRAWIAGLRREQLPSRAGVTCLDWDEEKGLALVNPLTEWTADQVWAHLRSRGVPYNRLHDQGYPSIGCAPCTRAVRPGEDSRAGRWSWENPSEKKECGLHVRGSGAAPRRS